MVEFVGGVGDVWQFGAHLVYVLLYRDNILSGNLDATYCMFLIYFRLKKFLGELKIPIYIRTIQLYIVFVIVQ